LISVVTGRAAPEILHSYSQERRAAAKGLIDYDHQWSRVVGARPDKADEEMPLVQKKFIEGGKFTAGLTVIYDSSALIGDKAHQDLAKGFDIGMRFHSAPVIRLADAKPMQLGHVINAGQRWYVFAFAGKDDQGQVGKPIAALSDFLENDPMSPLTRIRREGEDIDTMIDLRAVFQQGFRDLDHTKMPSLLRPTKGRFGLVDYEKVFCPDLKSGEDIFDLREINRDKGGMVVVRPDQHVAQVLPLNGHAALAAFFKGVFLPASSCRKVKEGTLPLFAFAP